MLNELYKAVKLVESGDNPLAVRFEEGFMRMIPDRDKAVVRARANIYAFLPSVKAYLSFSVGRCQFMVYNLYFVDKIYDYLLKQNLMPVRIPFTVPDEVEFELFKLFIAERMTTLWLKLSSGVRLNEDDLKTFSKLWNGSYAYYDKLVRYLK